MKVFARTLFLFLVICASGWAEEKQGKQKVAEAPKTKTLAILDFQRSDAKIDLTPQELRFMTDNARSVARANLPSASWTIIDRENMESMKKPGTNLADCGDECVFQLSEVLQADYIVTGTIGTIFAKHKMIFNLYDVKTRNSLGSESVTGSTLNDLGEMFEEAFRKLLTQNLPGATAGAGIAGAPVDMPEIRHIESPNVMASTGQKMYILEVHSEPPGAVVNVDGSLFCQSAPCSRAVPAGSRYLKLQSDRYLDTALRINVTRNQQKLVVSMRPNFATLSVTTTPSGIPVRINGRDAGVTPLIEEEVEAGNTFIEITSPCYLGVTRTLLLKRGEEKEISETLRPREAVLNLRALDGSTGHDIAARVWSGKGKALGETPFQEKVNVCLQEVQLVAPGYEDKRLRVSLTEGRTQTMQATMSASEGYGEAVSDESPVSATKRRGAPVYPFIGVGLGMAAATGSMHDIYETVMPSVEFDLLLGIGVGRYVGTDFYLRTGVALTAPPDETDEAEEYQKWVEAGEPEWVSIPLLGGIGIFMGKRSDGMTLSAYAEGGFNFTRDDFYLPENSERVTGWSTTVGYGFGANLMFHFDYTFSIYGGIRVLDAAYPEDTNLADIGIRIYGMGI